MINFINQVVSFGSLKIGSTFTKYGNLYVKIPVIKEIAGNGSDCNVIEIDNDGIDFKWFDAEDEIQSVELVDVDIKMKTKSEVNE